MPSQWQLQGSHLVSLAFASLLGWLVILTAASLALVAFPG